MTLTCKLDDPGFPSPSSYRWLTEGGVVMATTTTPVLMIQPVKVLTKVKCYAITSYGFSSYSNTAIIDTEGKSSHLVTVNVRVANIRTLAFPSNSSSQSQHNILFLSLGKTLIKPYTLYTANIGVSIYSILGC